MKQVVCINPKGYRLTQGREYTVANNPVRGFYRVTNDRERIVRYSEELFRDVVVEPEEDSVETILSTLRCSRVNSAGRDYCIQASLTIDGSEVSFNVYPNSEVRIPISCGINHFNNINVLTDVVSDEVLERGNLRASVISEIIKFAISNIRTTGIMLISTNTNNENIDLLKDSIALLQQSFRVEELYSNNPNSGNEIVLYSILVSPGNDIEEDDVEDITSIDQLIDPNEEERVVPQPVQPRQDVQW